MVRGVELPPRQLELSGKVKAKREQIWTARARPDMIAGMFRTLLFFGLVASALAGETLAVLVNAAASFSVAIVQQLAAVQSEQSPTVFAEKTVSYAVRLKSRFGG